MSQQDTGIVPAASVDALRQPKPVLDVVNVQGASDDVVADAAQGAFAKRPQTTGER